MDAIALKCFLEWQARTADSQKKAPARPKSYHRLFFGGVGVLGVAVMAALIALRDSPPTALIIAGHTALGTAARPNVLAKTETEHGMRRIGFHHDRGPGLLHGYRGFLGAQGLAHPDASAAILEECDRFVRAHTWLPFRRSSQELRGALDTARLLLVVVTGVVTLLSTLGFNGWMADGTLLQSAGSIAFLLACFGAMLYLVVKSDKASPKPDDVRQFAEFLRRLAAFEAPALSGDEESASQRDARSGPPIASPPHAEPASHAREDQPS